MYRLCGPPTHGLTGQPRSPISRHGRHGPWPKRTGLIRFCPAHLFVPIRMRPTGMIGNSRGLPANLVDPRWIEGSASTSSHSVAAQQPVFSTVIHRPEGVPLGLAVAITGWVTLSNYDSQMTGRKWINELDNPVGFPKENCSSDLW